MYFMEFLIIARARVGWGKGNIITKLEKFLLVDLGGVEPPSSKPKIKPLTSLIVSLFS